MEYLNNLKSCRDYSEDYYDELEDQMTYDDYWNIKEQLIDDIMEMVESKRLSGERRITEYLKESLDYDLNGVNGTFWRMYGVSANDMDKNHYDSQEDMNETINDIKDYYDNLKRPDLFIFLSKSCFSLSHADSSYFKTKDSLQRYIDNFYLPIDDESLALMSLKDLRDICDGNEKINYSFFFINSNKSLVVY